MSAKIHSLLEEAVVSKQFLGLSFIVVNKDGKLTRVDLFTTITIAYYMTGTRLYSGAHGDQDFNHTRPMTLKTGGWVASMSKLMTSVAVMHAIQKDLVGLDDDLGYILPELHQKKVLLAFDEVTGAAEFRNHNKAITIRQLLSHSSGFSYAVFPDNLLARWGRANGRGERWTGDFEKDWDYPLAAQPAEDWIYGTGIDWAGRVVEKVSGLTLEDYLRTYVWEPLGMADTTFHPDQRESFPVLEMGTRKNGPNSTMESGSPVYPIPAQNEAGGAGIFTSAEDYSKLLHDLLQDEGKILGSKSVEEFVKPQLTEASKKALKRQRDLGLILREVPQSIPVDHSLGGLYTAADVPGGRAKGSIAWDGMSSSKWLLDRNTGIALVFFVQVLPTDEIARELWMQLEKEIYAMVSHSLHE
ncbi:hypothetical protein D6D01_10257 [Aureobasidium pullulans]|uniref:Beta-lactamase-related domain-containing protein n=1 Tax=Aureobasidium pullulans TaxID=5580 RepID=A0A4S9JNM9_AURPU|nr:hypothetical protein D6D01_10257 [Aureobasidium pullulans]